MKKIAGTEDDIRVPAIAFLSFCNCPPSFYLLVDGA